MTSPNAIKPRLSLRFPAPATLAAVSFASPDAAKLGARRRGFVGRIWCVERPQGGWVITHVQ